VVAVVVLILDNGRRSEGKGCKCQCSYRSNHSWPNKTKCGIMRSMQTIDTTVEGMVVGMAMQVVGMVGVGGKVGTSKWSEVQKVAGTAAAIMVGRRRCQKNLRRKITRPKKVTAVVVVVGIADMGMCNTGTAAPATLNANLRRKPVAAARESPQ
jgi:hypothetical protein